MQDIYWHRRARNYASSSIALMTELAASHGLHSHGVVHGDLHISNALTLDGVLKWIDIRELRR
jgi:tRNA A-37 threonylcarbamoyl transferase component Bud32